MRPLTTCKIQPGAPWIGKRFFPFALTLLSAIILRTPVELRAEYVPKWPVYNGDFSTFSLTGDEVHDYLETGDPKKYAQFKDRCLPAGWAPETISGRHAFKKAEGQKSYLRLPYHNFEKFNRPSAAVIETIEAGRGCFVQALTPLKGEYRLKAEVRGSPEATPEVTFTSVTGETSGGTIAPGESWEQVQFDVSAPGGEVTIRLCSKSPAGQTVQFRNVMLEARVLESTAVPLEDGTQLGGIVLPRDPTPAEQFACYELQQTIFRMTGRVPGLKGRDKTHAGHRIRIGRAASSAQVRKLDDLPMDSYAVSKQERYIDLTGRTDQGTLYAVYDFLKQQGCRWVIPGREGDVIPRRDSLGPVESKLEAPDYDVRGVEAMAQDYFLRRDGERGWVAINLDDYFDWALRNRLNGIRFLGIKSYDFAAHRGHGYPQISNHSYNDTVAPHDIYFDEHPEWYPLVNGERAPKCHLPPYFPNQLCVSDPGLRDYTTKLVLDFFANEPQAKAFPLVPMDGPSLWCECDACKALDPPGIDWSRHATEGHVERMTDRSVNYANDIAQRVSEVYPDKKILVQAYGYTLEPPAKEKLHKNVLVRYANLSGGRGRGPLGVRMLEENPIWDNWRRQLDRWKEAGATITYYNYMDYAHPDTSLFWFYSTSDMIRTLHREYGFRAWFGETEPNKRVSFMLFHVMAETLWDVDADFRDVVRDLCHHYYGSAGDEMYAYTITMEKEVRASKAWKQEGWTPVRHQDIPVDILRREMKTLEKIAEEVREDPVLTRRVGYARLGHAHIMYVQSLYVEPKTAETRENARKAFERINSLRAEHDLVVKRLSADRLREFSYAPISDD